MPAIRVRKPFAAAFAVLLLAAAYLGLAENQIPQYGQSDKGLHFMTFFLLTLLFYWILDTSRRRLIHVTLLTCTAGLAIGSEIVQGLLPNGRQFDPYDVLANVVGSGLALGACAWYHKRMLERRRKNKHYDIVPGDDEDLELGESGAREEGLEDGVGVGAHETGVLSAAEAGGQAIECARPGGGTAAIPDVTEELDNWDENAEDWEDNADDTKKPDDDEEGEKKRAD